MDIVGIEEIKTSIKSQSFDDQIVVIEDLSRIPLDILGLPFKMSVVMVVFIRKGKIQVTIDDHVVTVHEGEMAIAFPPQVISDFMVSTDLEGGALAFATSKVSRIVFLNKQIWSSSNFIHAQPVFKLGEVEQEMLGSYYNIMKLSLSRNDMKYRSEMASSLFECFILELVNIVERQKPEVLREVPAKLPTSSNLFHRFLAMLNERPGQIRSVQEIASNLNISPKYLSTTVKQVSGKTALEWIHEVLFREIEQQMKYSARTIKEIAVNLGFDNLSFFSRIFKEHFGVSPSEYRKNINKN